MGGEKIGVDLGPEMVEWLSTKARTTAKAYHRRLRRFMRWYRSRYGDDVSISHFLDRLDENLRLPRRERKKLAELEMVEYIDYLKDGEGLANYTIRNNFVAIQNFLDYKGYSVSMRWIGNMPQARGMNGNSKHSWTLDQIGEFFEKADNFRDKAIILCMFQSGLAVNEIVNLDYGDVAYELEEARLPLLIQMVREKTGERFRTFLGADAVKYLKLYLETRNDLNEGSPLFTKLGSGQRITKGAIQKRFREIAEELSYIKLKEGNMNPARPHSMRSAFRTLLTGKGRMDSDLIETLLAHTSETKGTYINYSDEALREEYAKCEHFISVEITSKDILAGKAGKLKEIDQQYQNRIQDLETTLRTQASQLSQIAELNTRLDREIRELDARSGEQEQMIRRLEDLMLKLMGERS